MRHLPVRAVSFLCLAVIVTVLGAALAIPGLRLTADAVSSRGVRVTPLKGLAQRTTVVDGAGNVLGRLGLQDRTDVRIEDVPQVLQDAVVAVEDQTFWTNRGIDVHGALRATLKNIGSGDVQQGGSTITQQLMKNRVLNSKQTAERKLREAALALAYAKQYTKKEILEQYLNTVYFGQGAYGIQAAVERLFLVLSPFGYPVSPPLEQVTLGQAALLAGLIANPEGDNPFLHPERARERRSFALQRMVAEGYATTEEAAVANLEPMPSIKPSADLRPQSAWVEEVQDQLIRDDRYSVLGQTPKDREQRLLTGGLTIEATIVPGLQAAAQNAMNDILPEKPGFTGALVSIDPTTGAVRAMVAGPGFEESQYNIATSPPGRQAGSTWKVITLAAALTAGFSPQDQVNGTSPCEFPFLIGRTENFEPGGGVLTLRAATTGSVNCAYARTELAVGFTPIIDLAHKMGIRQSTLQPVLTLTLGSIETTPLEMATVAATIANGGVRHWPSFVEKITGPDGKVLFDLSGNPGERVVAADVIACETDLLRGVINSGTGTAARLAGGRPAAGKTGTTDGQSDANFLGFTPQLATFIWHGNATARVPGAGFGGDVPARVFKRYMDAALENQPVVQFPDPGPVCARPPSQSSVLGGGTTAPDDDALIESTPNRSAPNRPAPTQPPPQTAPSPKPTSPTTIPPTTPPTVPPTSPGGQ